MNLDQSGQFRDANLILPQIIEKTIAQSEDHPCFTYLEEKYYEGIGPKLIKDIKRLYKQNTESDQDMKNYRYLKQRKCVEINCRSF